MGKFIDSIIKGDIASLEEAVDLSLRERAINELKDTEMKSFSEYRHALHEASNFDKIDLSKHTTGMKAYSHGKHHEGYVDKGGAKVVHKDLHKHALASGYMHSRTFGDFAMKGGQVHTYKKGAGPYAEHHLAIHTNGAGKVWNVEHGTYVDKS